MISLHLPERTGPKLQKIGSLGKGAYGKVYQALDTEESVAVKCNYVSPEFTETIGALRELDILHKVRDHPYCVGLKDVSFGIPFDGGMMSPPARNSVSDKVYFIMEKGDYDAAHFVRKTHTSFDDRLLLAVNVLLAIEFIHSRGIYHRDIKPENIICFMKDGRLQSAKITDFGLAQHYECQSESRSGFVTMWYRAPEISLEKNYDYKADIWSVGCVLYEMFSLHHRRLMTPYDDGVLLSSLNKLIPLPQNDLVLAMRLYPGKIFPIETGNDKNLFKDHAFTDETFDLLKNCLEIDPERRYSASDCLNHSIFDRHRTLIARVRAIHGIDTSGHWVTRPEPCLLYPMTRLRARGMAWFQYIYTNRMRPPINAWYSHRILIHAIEMFDRYLTLVYVDDDTPESDLVVWVNTFIFMSAKYFRILMTEYGLNRFAIGIYPKDYYIFQERVYRFEEFVVKDIFRCDIYFPTIYECTSEHLTERAISYLLGLILNMEIPTGMPYTSILTQHWNNIVALNRSPGTVGLTIV